MAIFGSRSFCYQQIHGDRFRSPRRRVGHIHARWAAPTSEAGFMFADGAKNAEKISLVDNPFDHVGISPVSRTSREGLRHGHQTFHQRPTSPRPGVDSWRSRRRKLLSGGCSAGAAQRSWAWAAVATTPGDSGSGHRQSLRPRTLRSPLRSSRCSRRMAALTDPRGSTRSCGPAGAKQAIIASPG